MGIMLSKNMEDSELDRRISADLRSRAQDAARRDYDEVDDSAYVEGTKKTGRFTWIWVILIVLAIISLLCIVFI